VGLFEYFIPSAECCLLEPEAAAHYLAILFPRRRMFKVEFLPLRMSNVNETDILTLHNVSTYAF
jgi:hypothetical protein